MRTRSFSLIELLVVIGMIAVLAGIALPVLGESRERAKKTKALSECKTLEGAVSVYESTYGYLPHADTTEIATGIDDTDYTTMIEYLSCTGSNANARGIRMLEIKSASTYNDPWGNRYNVVFDVNYDGEITIDGNKVYRTVAIWSSGPDGVNNSGGGDDVAGWSD